MKQKTIILIVAGIIVGFIIGQEYTKYSISQKIEKAFSQPSIVETTREKDKNLEKELKKAIDKNIGDEIELATIKLKINSSVEENIIQSKYGSPKVADEGTKFVVLDLTITNITKSPFSFDTDGFNLVDDDNTQYYPYEYTISNIDNYLDMEELSPNISKTGKIVYLIPKTIESYSLIVKKGGTLELFKIKVK